MLLAQLKLDLDQLAVRIDEADAVIKKTAHENEACRRLVAILRHFPRVRLFQLENGVMRPKSP
jgi:hypothetical protein